MKTIYLKDLIQQAQQGKAFFTSKSQKLKGWHILLQKLSSGNFNPHTSKRFAEYSIFKSQISHGVGVIARAEAQFLQTLVFVEAVEVIGRGMGEIRLASPLKRGDRYQFTYELSNPRKVDGRWDFECTVTCMCLSPESRLIARWHWKPSFVEHENLPEDGIKMLKPRTYFRNLIEVFVFRPAEALALTLLVSSFLGTFIAMTLNIFGVISLPNNPIMEGMILAP